MHYAMLYYASMHNNRTLTLLVYHTSGKMAQKISSFTHLLQIYSTRRLRCFLWHISRSAFSSTRRKSSRTDSAVEMP